MELPVGFDEPSRAMRPDRPAAIPDPDDDLRIDELGLGDPGDGSPGALPTVGGPLHDAAHEEAFFDQPASPDESGLLRVEVESEPVSKAAYVALGLVVSGILGGVIFFAVRDTVEPREAPNDALESSWYQAALKARPAVVEEDAIDAGWRTGFGEDGGAMMEAPGEMVGALDAGASPVAEPGKGTPDRPEPGEPASTVRAEVKGDFVALMTEGQRMHKDGHFDEAAARFEKALALAPSDERALLAYASSLLELNRGKQALDAATKVARINPRNARAHLIIGAVRQDMGEKEAAIEAYETYLRLSPTGPYAKDVDRVLKGMR